MVFCYHLFFILIVLHLFSGSKLHVMCMAASEGEGELTYNSIVSYALTKINSKRMQQ